MSKRWSQVIMLGVLAGDLKDNLFAMDPIREQDLRPLWKRWKKKRQLPGVVVSTQKIDRFVTGVIKTFNYI
jgi:hypothetical protein